MAVSGSKDLSAAGVTRPPGAVLSRPVELVGVALLMVTATYLLASYFNHLWLVGADGNGIPDDFVNVWAAGRMVLEGHSPAAGAAMARRLRKSRLSSCGWRGS